ncbi:MAG: Mor transcription activator family protein [Ramlibacter sp.]|nr:hypothetical protein [Ramlibacter sp.]
MSKSRKLIKAKNRTRVRAFVASATEIIKRRLMADVGVLPVQAEEIARDCAHDICAGHGGLFMYVPKDVEFTLTKRDLEIFERYNGRNMPELVEEFGVTHIRIYQIVAKVKARLTAERQGVLPGMDE